MNLSFSTFSTKRLHVSLHELRLEDTMALCEMSPKLYEAGTTRLLKGIVDEVVQPKPGQVTDIGLWTVQERASVMALYLSHVRDDGPNFEVGENAVFTDYRQIDEGVPPHEFIDMGTVADDHWLLYPLLGCMAESIERLINTGQLPARQSSWWYGCMGAMMLREGKDTIPPWSDWLPARIDEYILARAKIIVDYPTTKGMLLLGSFLAAHPKLDHLLKMYIGASGIVWLPVKAQPEPHEGQEVQALGSARFPFTYALNETAVEVFGKAE